MGSEAIEHHGVSGPQFRTCGRNVCGIGAVVSGGVYGAPDQLQPMQMKRHAGLKRSGILSFGKERPWSRQSNVLSLLIDCG